MRSRTTDDANDVRAFLERMAEEAQVVPAVPGRALRRARRRIAATTLAGIAVLALAGYGVVSLVDVAREWNRPIPAEEPTPVPTPSATSPVYDRGSASEELSRYVLQAFEGPKVADEFRFVVGKAWALGTMAKTFGIPVDDLLQAGLVDAYVNLWTTPGWYGEGREKDLISVVWLFPDAAAAHEGFALLDVEGTWERWRSLPTGGLGEEATVTIGRYRGKATVSYAWRMDELVLIVASQGSLSPEIVGPLADEVQARVEAFHPPS